MNAAAQAITAFFDSISSDSDEHKPVRQHYHSEAGIVLFVEEILGVNPSNKQNVKPYQKRILKTFYREKRLAVKSLHGVGKTAMAAWIVLWMITTAEGEVKVITTASRWNQLRDYLWPEIRKWSLSPNSAWDKLGISMRDKYEVLEQMIKLGYNKRATAIAPDTPSSIEGAHADTLLYVFDEAKSIPTDIFDAVEGAFASAGEDVVGDAYAFVISTPGTPLGEFYNIITQKPGYAAWGTDGVSLEEALACGQVSQAWVNDKKLKWGETDPRYINRVIGDFAESAENSLFKLSWLEDTVQRWRDCNGKGKHGDMLTFACDPADEGRDMTCVGRMLGHVVESLKYYDCDTMQGVEEVRREVGVLTKATIGIDTIGVGAGVYSRLKELKYKPVSLKASAKTDATDSSGENAFLNLRAAMYWGLREAIDPSSPAYRALALPPDELLMADLLAHTWSESMGVLRIDPKDEVREKLAGRSPDGGDTVVMLWYLQWRRKSWLMI